uniref:Uncharacterized protein n=1 Tax=Panagrolaimus sp. JU765 TaxID=591449 RepID=A0AC34PX02_9BILA
MLDMNEILGHFAPWYHFDDNTTVIIKFITDQSIFGLTGGTVIVLLLTSAHEQERMGHAREQSRQVRRAYLSFPPIYYLTKPLHKKLWPQFKKTGISVVPYQSNV